MLRRTAGTLSEEVPPTTGDRDLADPEIWQQSLERSLARRKR
jgi:hypothetical protein